MNHFCCGSGIESFERVRPELSGGGDNGWGVLYPRVVACTAANGLNIKPNFIAVDWAHIGDAFEVAEYLTIGGKIGGIGQHCATGIDCATGSCDMTNRRCQCQVCDADNMYCNGCNAGESCISIRDGSNECSNSFQIAESQLGSGAAVTKSYLVFVLSLLIHIWIIYLF